MAYIGKQPVVGNFQKCDAITVVNGQAAYTLNVGGSAVNPENANHMLVSLNGVLQAPGDSFTVSGSTLTFASNLATGDVIDFVIILGDVLDLGTPSDNSISTAKLVANSVTAAKFNADVISGQTALAEAPADTDELLISDGGVIKRIDYSLLKSTPHKTLLHTVTASNSASIEFDNTYITSTYRDYHITWSNVHSASDARLDFKVSDDNGSSYKTDSDHQRASFGLASDTNTISSNSNDSGTQFEVTPLNLGSDTGESTSGHLTLFNFLGTDNFKQSQGHVTFTLGNQTFAHFLLSFTYKKTNALNAVKFVMSSGNISSGVFKIYGIT
jgi:hypothetical protein